MSKNIGLVLSGGGVRGVAHIGVLKVLEEEDIEITHVSGTSAGSIVGSLYAADYSPEEILEFFEKSEVFSISNYALFKPGIIDTGKLVKLFEKFFPEDSFEALAKQLFVVATDLEKAKSKVFDSGELIRTVLASSAFPMMFSPVTIDDVLYADGGIMNNFPIEPLQDKCDKIIGVYVNPLNSIDKEELSSSLAIAERSYHLSIGSASVQKFDQIDLVICPSELAKFDTFNVKQIKKIYQIGYDAAKKQREEIIRLCNG